MVPPNTEESKKLKSSWSFITQSDSTFAVTSWIEWITISRCDAVLSSKRRPCVLWLIELAEDQPGWICTLPPKLLTGWPGASSITSLGFDLLTFRVEFVCIAIYKVNGRTEWDNTCKVLRSHSINAIVVVLSYNHYSYNFSAIIIISLVWSSACIHWLSSTLCLFSHFSKVSLSIVCNAPTLLFKAP